MFRFILQFIYYTFKTILFPYEYLWTAYFRLQPPYADKIIIVGTVGGSGKTTLAKNYLKFHDHVNVRLDDCKFGEQWKRLSANEFTTNLNKKLLDQERYVIDGIYHDPKLKEQKEEIDKLLPYCDLVIWNDIPKYIAVWRKFFRSCKRAIKVEPDGTAPEKWHNVKEMLKKAWYTFNDRQVILDNMWNENNLHNEDKFKRAKWPYFYAY